MELFAHFVAIVDDLLGEHLPEAIVNDFVASENFETYRAVLESPETTDDETRAFFYNMVDDQLGNMPDASIQAFVASPDLKSTAKSVNCTRKREHHGTTRQSSSIRWRRGKPVAKPNPSPRPSLWRKPRQKPSQSRHKSQPKLRKHERLEHAPVGLADDYELATTMNRRITWLVNFIINFGVLFAAIFISMSDTGITTILYAVSAGIIILNGIFIPMKFSRNLGQFVSRTKFIRGDGTNPLFLHGILVNMTGLLSLIGVSLSSSRNSNR